MKVEHVAFLQLLIMFLIGPPLALLSDQEGFFYGYLLMGRDPAFIYSSYACACYAVAVLVILYRFGLRQSLTLYQAKPFVDQGYRFYFNVWLYATLLALIMAAVLVIQADFSHPLIGTWAMTPSELVQKRANIAQLINGTVFNIGLHVFVALSLAVSFFFLKKKILSLISLCVFVFFATFSMQKSPIAAVVLQLVFVYLLMRKASWKPLLYIALALAALGALTAFAARTSFDLVLQALSARLFLGEFAPLPTYFEVFHQHAAPLTGLLPPYVQAILSVQEQPASRIVIEYMLGFSDAIEMAGVANSMFVGTAYAHLGMIGVILSPFIVFANFYVVLRLFRVIRKDIINVFALAYLLFRLTVAMNSSIGYFLFSGIQIAILAVFAIEFAALMIRKETSFPSGWTTAPGPAS